MKRKYILIIVAVVLMATGAFFVFFGCEKEKYEGLQVQETPLQNMVSLSADSTYLVFCFIYTCEFCQNSVKNINEYEKMGLIDKVIGLSFRDSVGLDYFLGNYQPDFQIITTDVSELFAFTTRFPTSCYITGNTIKKVFRGEMPPAGTFGKLTKRWRKK